MEFCLLSNPELTAGSTKKIRGVVYSVVVAVQVGADKLAWSSQRVFKLRDGI
jgi:hypothetical protein